MLPFPMPNLPRASKKTPYRHSSFSSVDTHDFDDSLYLPDPEKAPSSPDSASTSFHSDRSSRTSYSTSSRHASDTYRTPIFAKTPPHRRRCYKLPHRTVRYLCLFLIATVVMIIASLIRMSYVSSRQVATVNENRPLPPPQWGTFPFLQRYYGGLRTLVSRAENVPEYPRSSDEEPAFLGGRVPRGSKPPASIRFDPYPDYASPKYLAEFGPVHDCVRDTNLSDTVRGIQAYPGVPAGFPEAVMGSAETLGLRDDLCYERYGRFGPYGYGYSVARGGTGAGLHGDRDGIEDVWAQGGEIDYQNIRWAELQDRCHQLNRHRFAATPETERRPAFYLPGLRPTHQPHADGGHDAADGPVQPMTKRTLPRTAVLIRTWWTYDYREADILFLRSLISELSLLSGGEYTVHILVHVQDDNAQIWADERVYEDVLRISIPEEFRGLASLWTERQMGLIYGGLQETFFRSLPVHGAYRSTYLPVHWFAEQHPEYEYFWHWEMDARYTGHLYHLLDRVSSWSKEQPRKGLWERSGRFYVPSVHGSWDDFKQMVRVQSEYGTDNANNIWSALAPNDAKGPGVKSKHDDPIWGPVRPADDEVAMDSDPVPPTSYDKDRYEWGVGEEADLISFNPMFDPDGTEWILSDDVTGYNTSQGMPPRRSATITTLRLSRRLLHTMHQETLLLRHSMFSEMWPASCALHHGLKAVYAPHPVYIDRDWPPTYLAAVFNGGRNGATGGARTSVFGGRQHNFLGTTWFYNAGFAPNLWKRWLGFKINNDGGEEEEVANEGRMCLPGMLLHPIKDVRLVVQDNRGNLDEASVRDPEAR
ncbi:MAG: hypothetical protein M1838_003869 [Thelocarpon superellum]|nr:MAG: hypothetical protein M1838_003869 [Thelocarpon superellum]